jgi:hypothetical protein
MEQLESQLPAADIELPDDVLDRIDEIVTPGTNITPPTAGGSSQPCSRQRDAGRSRCAAPVAQQERPRVTVARGPPREASWTRRLSVS